jgi:ribA/ribD-fused uncharacterized protein
MEAAAVPAITRFRGDYHFLSNFYEADVPYGGKLYPTAEHAYQAAKTGDPEVKEAIRRAKTPGEAKRMGRRAARRLDWLEVRRSIMYAVVQAKFLRHADLRQKLLDTGDAVLIEGNDWGDRYWGMVENEAGTLKGENHLGQILMRVRAELRR